MNQFLYYPAYFSLSFLIVLLTIPIVKVVAYRVGAIDKGADRKIHTGEVARLGGASIFVAFVCVAFFVYYDDLLLFTHYKIFGILVGSFVVFLLGVYDDIKGIKVWSKLAWQTLAALIVYFWGVKIEEIFNPFSGGGIGLFYLSLPFTVLWILVITNAFNLVDGLDGLAAGTGIVIALTISFTINDFNQICLLVAMTGALAGFLRYNFYPASIFMGDSGSLFVGFFLGAVSIANYQKGTALIAFLVPVIAFGFPLMDMFYAVIRRFSRGVPLGQADKEHMHHKLIEWGLSKKKAVYVLYAFNIFLMILALYAIRSKSEEKFLLLTIFVVVVIVGVKLFGYADFIPSVKILKHNIFLDRKRKYFSFLIRKFRENLKRSTTRDVNNAVNVVEKFLLDIGFDYAEMSLNSPVFPEGKQVIINKSDNSDKLIHLRFPLLDGEKTVGYMGLKRDMTKDDPYVSMDILSLTLSREIVRIVKKFERSGTHQPNRKNK